MISTASENLDFDPDGEQDVDLSDASGSLSDQSNHSNEYKGSKDENTTNDIESEPEDNIHEEDLSRTAMASIKNIRPETGVNEETYTFVPTQELLSTLNREDSGNPMPDFVPDTAQPELTFQPENVGGQQNSGHVWKRTEVDSQCECNTLINLKEKEVAVLYPPPWVPAESTRLPWNVRIPFRICGNGRNLIF
ncbi:hypothetical protein K443DRAFT_6759 [Laccaria amethystina LaAM-08-1]|uniref:Uncharacterized protein n=1 Tax=Laccaria amethystina LaAM-08-1 TaxID=1095629 RepID=A0A0C9XVD9_9AGAR|nr:hypothetical protein K443DRAFT_6759 [Laccaria amethystina LaAM-08-1]